jgi:hypothetical protein
MQLLLRVFSFFPNGPPLLDIIALPDFHAEPHLCVFHTNLNPLSTYSNIINIIISQSGKSWFAFNM